jgi:hypothetical protein
MKQFFFKALLMWHEVRAAYRGRYDGHRLGS